MRDFVQDYNKGKMSTLHRVFPNTEWLPVCRSNLGRQRTQSRVRTTTLSDDGKISIPGRTPVCTGVRGRTSLYRLVPGTEVGGHTKPVSPEVTDSKNLKSLEPDTKSVLEDLYISVHGSSTGTRE